MQFDPLSALVRLGTLSLTLGLVSAPALAQVEVDEAVTRGGELLLANQERYVADRPVGRLRADEFDAWQTTEKERMAKVREDAAGKGVEWPYEGVYRVAGGVVPSGYRVGGTSIVCESLISAPGFAEDEARQQAVRRSVLFVLDVLADDPTMAAGPKERYDVRGWGHTYALDLFLHILRDELLADALREQLQDAVPDLIDRIAVNENPGGGWNYANTRTHSPFQTGATLLTLYHARAQGFEVDADLVTRALDALESGRDTDTGAFAYSGTGTEPMHASSARAAVAELSLFRAGRGDTDALRRSVEGFFNGWNELKKRKSQQGTHEGPYGIAPYYFFFGHTYAARAIEYLPEDERAEWRVRLQEALWKTRESHGGWNDRIFPRTESYSTAMVLQALLAPTLTPIPEWSTE